MTRRPWESFLGIRSQSFVPDQMKEARTVTPYMLQEMESYRKQERVEACNGHDPLRTLVAYAQDELIYDAAGNQVAVTRGQYEATPREQRVNVFGPAYRKGAKLYLNTILADIIVGAAAYLYRTQGWTTVIYDGLRTMEGAYKLYRYAHDEDLAAGLLALPGQSAHNKGLAVDSMMIDRNGREVEMGGHFDHLDMSTNGRAYNGDKITATAKMNRRIREAAFLHSAFAQGLLIAPLKPEFWDDRLPENRSDLWRVLDSVARCIGLTLLTPEDEKMRRENRKAFEEKWESWSYLDFLSYWDEFFRGHQGRLREVIGTMQPPANEKPEFYHGNYDPIYDADLKASGKNLTEGPAFP